ncbi:multivesicular body subunit 12Bb [Chanos chanos]|uniref:Multivesicular body subunit 12Bb n=1 Tax=Chanos chanos TaxID=29144 RepID=A0A6J2WIF1_CHACN|nr:multivesicular body subunit 12B-like [Chanos chanos]
MPDLQELSKALDELPDPITNVAVLASRKEAPANYYVVAQTTDGLDADLWKDGLFKSKVTRYLCFTRAFSSENSQVQNVVVDMKLTDLRDPLLEGFVPVQLTTDTQEQALRKKRLCMKLVPRHSTDMAICDVIITGKTKTGPPNYTFIGDLNSMGIWYRMRNTPKIKAAASQAAQSVPANAPDQARQKAMPHGSTLPKRNTVRPDYEDQSSNSKSSSAVDDIPFMISEKFVTKPSAMQPVNLMGITIKSVPEIEQEYAYSFQTELSTSEYLSHS